MPVGIEHRLAADANRVLGARLRLDAIDEVAERLAAIERLAMLAPEIALLGLGEIPARATDEARGLEAEALDVVRDERHAVLGVGLPPPVRGGVGEIAEALF